MFFRPIKEKLLQKKHQKEIKSTQTIKHFNEVKITNVGVITTKEINTNLDIETLVKEVLKVDKVTVFIYQELVKSKEQLPKNTFTEQSFNWRGNIVSKDLSTFLNTPYHLLISAFDTSNIYLEMATVFSKASFKVGFSKINENLFDIEIDSNSNEFSLFLSELKKYLGHLNKLSV